MGKRSEKIRNYNQLLLAVTGTLLFLFLLFVGVIAISEMLGSLGSYNEPMQEGILATKETDELLVDSLRKQIISFKNMNLIDSTNKVYLLPVGQADLSEEESFNDDEMLGLINGFSGHESDYYRYRNITFNNFVVFESIGNRSEVVFDQRISISDYLIIRRGRNIYILITATDKDSNVDGYMNEDDLQDLHLYDINSRKLTKIESKEKFAILSIDENDKTNDVILKFGFDKNGNGKFEYKEEPVIYYMLDLETKTLVEMVQDIQINKLQQLLEGR